MLERAGRYLAVESLKTTLAFAESLRPAPARAATILAARGTGLVGFGRQPRDPGADVWPVPVASTCSVASGGIWSSSPRTDMRATTALASGGRGRRAA